MFKEPAVKSPPAHRPGARRVGAPRLITALSFTLLSFILLPGCILMNNNLDPFHQTRKPLEEKTVEGQGRDKILIIDISDLITGQEQEGRLGQGSRESTVARVKEALRKAEKDNAVRGLVLRVDSPGGGVTASDIIYREVKRFKEKRGVPVIAAMMDVAASGGYYVSLAADRIIAHPTTVTGSVGVIMINLNVAELFEKIGVEDTSVTSGEHKDIGSPFREPTESDRKILQEVIDDLYAQFLDRVREGRKEISDESIEKLADGRILTAGQALEAGFIDRIGYLEDAIGEAKKSAGLSQAKVVIYHRPGEFADNIYSLEGNPSARAGFDRQSLLRIFGGSGPRFLYLWAPGLP
jgi:protease-4